jgi:hypothetical protein
MKLHEEWKNFLSFCGGHKIYSSKVGIRLRKTKCTLCEVRDRSASYVSHTFKQAGVFNDQ